MCDILGWCSTSVHLERAPLLSPVILLSFLVLEPGVGRGMVHAGAPAWCLCGHLSWIVGCGDVAEQKWIHLGGASLHWWVSGLPLEAAALLGMFRWARLPGSTDAHVSFLSDFQGGSGQRNQPSTMQQKSQATKTAYGTSPYWTN